MNIRHILQQRLLNQHLSTPFLKTPESVVSHMGAIQAQDYPMSKWAVGLRMPHAHDDLIETAINEGRILRTHILRPTWHLVTPADIRWMLALTGPYVKKGIAHYDKKLELTEAFYKKTNKLICKALETGHLTRSEIKALLDQAGIKSDPHRLVHIMIRPELDGLICSGARKGKQTSYALLDDRVPPAAPLSQEEALAKLAFRYFNSHGPATVKDFAWWSGLPITLAKQGLASIEQDLDHEAGYYFKSHSGKATNTIHLLPNFDEYLVSYNNKPAGQAFFKNTILVNGEIAGTWTREIKKDKVTVSVETTEALNAAKFKKAQHGFATKNWTNN
jgi:hypothetical protein